MIDFETELAKLLEQESKPLPQSELVELASAGQQLLQSLNKKQNDISMQIEELYDLAKESDNTALQESMRVEKARAGLTVWAVVGLCDLIVDFYEYSKQCENKELEHQALMMRKKGDGLLAGCGITRIGEEGQPLIPAIHSVHSAANSHIPHEHVLKVLQSGYLYMGTVLRKSTVVVSLGMESPEEPEQDLEEPEQDLEEPEQDLEEPEQNPEEPEQDQEEPEQNMQESEQNMQEPEQ